MHDSAKRSLRLLPVLVALTLTVGACSGSTSTDSSLTSPSATLVTESFSGSITQNGTAIHPFAVKTTGNSLLVGFTSVSPSSLTALGMGIGTWDGTTCGLNLSQNDSAKVGNTGLSGTAQLGNYCIRVYDGGNITDSTITATYTLQVQHY